MTDRERAVSASKKLRALYESAYEGANGRTLDGKPLGRVWQRPHSEELIALANALPQIVAVVEAADEHCLCLGLETVQMLDGSRQPCPVHAALAALTEALS
jgi:hypothetical protein